uniref:Uncharacterized protein n=1 Tax=viral metagenome TaxID=1070528 RepID=A0A6M3M488_9ZZZZ
MKKLEKEIAAILSPTLVVTGESLEAGVLAKDVNDVVSDVMKAIGEYFHELEEVACLLLEMWPLPNNTITIKSKVTDTCTLAYSISKE